jgi:hypothetical protein
MNRLFFAWSGALGVALFLSGVTVAACAKGNSTAGNGSAGSGSGSGGTSTDGGGGQGGSFGGASMTGGASGSGSSAAPVIYVHSNTTLYTANPAAADLAVTKVGDIDCIGGPNEDTSLTDLAVSATGEIWGISKTNVFRLEISGGAVECTKTIPLKNPESIRFYGLTFAPKGVLDPDKEVLIAGNTAGELWSVDESGVLTARGTLGTVPVNDGNGHSYPNSGKKWELSGDIVFLENGGSPAGFATVRDCPNPPASTGCNPIDTLVELDVPRLATATTDSVLKSLRGQVVKSADCNDSAMGYGEIFGITAYKDIVYGFSRSLNGGGLAISINNDSGEACKLKAFAQEWSGAGITTTAEVVIPPPK